MIVLIIVLIFLILLVFLFDHSPTFPIDCFCINKISIPFLFKNKIYVGGNGNKIFLPHYKNAKIIKLPYDTRINHISYELKDGTQCNVSISYLPEFPSDNKKQEYLYNILNRANPLTNQDYVFLKIDCIIEQVLLEELFSKSSKEARTVYQKNNLRKNIIKEITNKCSCFLDFKILSFDYSIYTYENVIKFNPIKLDYNSLLEAGYNAGQINQILKANEKGIYLGNINPIVSENILRKIKSSFEKNKELIIHYIEMLSYKDITQDEINNLCDEIMKI